MPSSTVSFTFACGKARRRPRRRPSYLSSPTAFFCSESVEEEAIGLACGAAAGGAGQTSGVLLHAEGAVHSARPTATHWPLVESPHQAQAP